MIRSGILASLILASAGGLGTGCADGGATPLMARSLAAEPTRAPTKGVWDHLEAAVIYAAERHELVLLETIDRSTGDQLRRRFVLLTVRDREMVVDATGDILDGIERVRSVEARLAPFGDRERERELVRTIEARLEKLERGGGVAPG